LAAWRLGGFPRNIKLGNLVGKLGKPLMFLTAVQSRSGLIALAAWRLIHQKKSLNSARLSAKIIFNVNQPALHAALTTMRSTPTILC
jgi:hypothetical protein